MRSFAELEGLRLLLVEDDEDTRELLTEVLQLSGCEVCSTSSASEAFAQLGSFAPAIIVSDIGMPVEDGLALMRRIRALPVEQGGRVPAIALTAFTLPRDRELSREAGFDMHLAKPVDLQELRGALAQLARRQAEP